MTRERVSLWAAVAGAVFLGGRGLFVFLQDGSYFLDAASVVISLQNLTLLETFAGPLETGHSFPRVYLALIRGLRALLGPETWATRLLPHAAYLAATFLWMRLFAVRFKRWPSLVVLGALLTASAPDWWTYAAVVKQYSLDALVAVALFSVPDHVLDESLGGRRRRWRLLLLVVPVLLSYTYVIVLLARVGAWGVWSWRRARRPEPVSAALFAGLLLAGLGLLWLTDVRHVSGDSALVSVWERCIAARQAPEGWPELARRFLTSWYVGPTAFFFPPKLAAPAVWALAIAQAIGVVRVLVGLFSPASDEGSGWGSRSAGCVVALGGAVAASFLLDYPICSGRSTLFLLALEQILVLEGLEWLGEQVGPRLSGKLRALRALVPLALAALVTVVAVHAFRVHLELAPRLPLEDLRPLLSRVREDPTLPVLVTPCVTRQLQTLPEGLEGLDLRWLPISDWERLVPRDQEVWILHSRLNPGLCERILRKLRWMTRGLAVEEKRVPRAVVYRASIRSQAEIRSARRRAMRALRQEAQGQEALRQEALRQEALRPEALRPQESERANEPTAPEPR